MGTDGGTWLAVGHAVVAVMLSLEILLNKYRPVSAAFWLGLVWMFPIWGALGFLVFGLDRARSVWAVQEHHQALSERHSALLEPGTERSVAPDRPAASAMPIPAGHIFRATEPAVQPFRVTPGNAVDLLVDGDRLYPALLDAIESAEHFVYVQSYIIAPDVAGGRLLAALERRARDGLTIRVLYDRFGSAHAAFTGIFRQVRDAGVLVRPARAWGRVNLRNHRKVAIIDGRTAFVGGMNIDDRNVTGGRRVAPDRDYHARIRGPVTRDLQLQFLTDWAASGRESVEDMLALEDFPEVPDAGRALVQVVAGGPYRSGSGLSKAYFAAIASGSESVTVVTPYFLPDEAIFAALRFAALRGARVRVIVPATSNHWYTAYAARAQYAPLLRSGIRIFERRPPFMHAKALVVDGVYAMIGSANLNYRSLHLNFELNIEVAEPDFVAALERQVEDEIRHSDEVSLEAHEARPVTVRLTENLCRLFQPVL